MRPLMPIAAVAALLVIALVTYPAWGGGDAQGFETVVGLAGWVLVAAALVLAIWRPARLPGDAWAALAVLGAACFAAQWLVQFVEDNNEPGLHLGMVVALSAGMVAVAASSRSA